MLATWHDQAGVIVNKPSCANCRFSMVGLGREEANRRRDDVRTCRYNPPVIIPIEMTDNRRSLTLWPEVYDSDWCGRWEPQETGVPVEHERQPDAVSPQQPSPLEFEPNADDIEISVEDAVEIIAHLQSRRRARSARRPGQGDPSRPVRRRR